MAWVREEEIDKSNNMETQHPIKSPFVNLSKDADNPSRFTKEEMAELKRAFGGNEFLLKLLRKIFIPSFREDVPLGQEADMWMDMDFKQVQMDELKTLVVARQELMKYLIARIVQIKGLANWKEESQEEREQRMRKDSGR